MSNEKINAEDNKAQSKDINNETSRKDCKGKYVNMAFTDDNYDFIVARTSELCVNFTSFINHPWRKGKSSAPKRKGDHLKRIYLKLKAENYEKINACAEQNESSNTGIVNVILEVYRQKL